MKSTTRIAVIAVRSLHRLTGGKIAFPEHLWLKLPPSLRIKLTDLRDIAVRSKSSPATFIARTADADRISVEDAQLLVMGVRTANGAPLPKSVTDSLDRHDAIFDACRTRIEREALAYIILAERLADRRDFFQATICFVKATGLIPRHARAEEGLRRVRTILRG